MGNQYYETETQAEYDARTGRDQDSDLSSNKTNSSTNGSGSGCLVALVGGALSLGAGGLGVYESIKYFIN